MLIEYDIKQITSNYDTIKIYSDYRLSFLENNFFCRHNFSEDEYDIKILNIIIKILLHELSNDLFMIEISSGDPTKYYKEVTEKYYGNLDIDNFKKIDYDIMIKECGNSIKFLANCLKYIRDKEYHKIDGKALYHYYILPELEESNNYLKNSLYKVLKKIIAYESGICKDFKQYNFKYEPYGEYTLIYNRFGLYHIDEEFHMLSFCFDELYDKAEEYVRKRFSNYNIKIPKKRYTFSEIYSICNNPDNYFKKNILVKYNTGKIKEAEKIRRN